MGNLPQLDGAAATDYTVYTKNDLTLRRGEKAILTLFAKKIKYTHIYRWSPPAAMEHSLVLLNQTTSAWTTGPCLALNEDQPLSEDLLKYTPKGGRGELPVTTAINVAHDKSEREIDRKLKAYSPQTQHQLRSGHAGRQAEVPQLREADGRYRDQQSRHRQALERRLGRHAGRRFQQAPFARARRECTLEVTARTGRGEDAHLPVRAVRAVELTKPRDGRGGRDTANL